MNKDLLFQVWKIHQEGNFFVGKPFDLRSISGETSAAPVDEGRPLAAKEGRPPAAEEGATAAEEAVESPSIQAVGQNTDQHFSATGTGQSTGQKTENHFLSTVPATEDLPVQEIRTRRATKRKQANTTKQKHSAVITNRLSSPSPSSYSQKDQSKKTAQKIRSFLKSWIKTINKFYQRAYPKFKLIKKKGKTLKGLIKIGQQIIKFNDITKFIMFLVTTEQSFIPKSLQNKIKQILGSVINFCDKVHNSKDFKRIRKELKIT